MESNILIYALNEFKVTYRKFLYNYTHYNYKNSIIKFERLVVGPYSLFRGPLGYIWLLGTFVKIHEIIYMYIYKTSTKLRNLAVRGLRYRNAWRVDELLIRIRPGSQLL